MISRILFTIAIVCFVLTGIMGFLAQVNTSRDDQWLLITAGVVFIGGFVALLFSTIPSRRSRSHH